MSVEEVLAKKAEEKEIQAGIDAQVSKTEAQEQIKQELARLDRVERTTGRSGIMPLGPKQRLMQVSEATKQKNKDFRLRWINENNQEKAITRQADGYERVPNDEGGRKVGNLALYRLPKEEYEHRVREIERETANRLSSHNREMENMADQVAKVLRDKHGISIGADRLLIKE